MRIALYPYLCAEYIIHFGKLMCGIVGYIGKQQAYPILIKGLHRLEYRGYDSAGVALVDNKGQLNVYKAKGKVSELEAVAQLKDTTGTIGIAHTRWATHGEPNTRNAHPHCSESGNLAIIHNGIIENYEPLRRMLLQHGCTFRSDTDTEVLIQLVEYIRKTQSLSTEEAVLSALRQVKGAYAIAIVERGNTDTIIAARKGSPLVVGLGKDETFLASDATPIVEYTQDIVYLGDEQIAVLSKGQRPVITDLDGKKLSYTVKQASLSLDRIEKGEFSHYMLKEIFEQPQTLRDTLNTCIDSETGELRLQDFYEHRSRFAAAGRIIILACGTSWHAALVARYAIEQYARIPCEVEYASEFRYRNPVINKDDIVIAVSQSGETADTLAAMELAGRQGAFLFSICNVKGSSIPRISDACCYTNVGPEIGVASTKAFTAQLLTLTLLAIAIGRQRRTIQQDQYESIVKEVFTLPSKIENILANNDRIKRIVPTYAKYTDCLYIGRGYNYPVALEGALKLKEISYIHAEGYPAGELKHGPIALISEQMPVVAIAPDSGLYEKTVSNILEIKARHGKIISVVTEGDTQVSDMSEFSIEIPKITECLSPILSVVPLQLLAYHIAVAKGCDVDQPRNLAKSVTVE